MKLNKFIPAVALLGLMAAGTSCDMTPELPPVVGPDYGLTVPEASMTILEFKQQFWNANPNSCEQIGLDANGDSIYLRGRVVSSDSAGNIYKSLVIRDESAALAFSINKSGLYKLYQYGQEIVVNVTGQYVGTYRSLFQVGGDGTTETSFGDADLFAAQTVPAGWADPSAVKPLTVTCEDLKTIKSSTEGLQEWQSQLVRIDGLTFENAGQEFAPSQNESRYLRDAEGNRINLRCSSYAKFAKDVIPTGTGSVVGILSYYGSTTANADWQLMLININGLIGFDKVESGNGGENGGENGAGSKDDPYTVAAAMANNSGTAWVKGYIVGAMNTSDSNNYVFENAAPFSVVANIYIAATPDETNTANMLPVQLPAGNALRSALNLQDNPSNLSKEVVLHGSLEKYFGQPGIKSTDAAILDGTEIGSAGEDTPGATAEFVRATSIADGQYIIWSDNKVGLAFQDGYNYGYMQSADCTPAADGVISASEANLFTFTLTADKGWTIADSHGQYLYQDSEHDSFQLTKSPDLSSDYCYWTITAGTDGSFVIVNCGTGKTMRYDPAYKTYAAYADASKGSAVYLYQSK
ncbi:MAG: hypothetical protein HDR45_00490 [Bacteroides sp.]|nr:hypothetical protein [Bacteroides sp.]